MAEKSVETLCTSAQNLPSTSIQFSASTHSSTSKTKCSVDNTISKSSVGTPTKKSGKKGVQSKNVINLTGRLIDADDWVNVPEFIPRTIQCEKRSNKRLCPYAERDGICKYPPGECAFIHGNICELCAKPALHPFDEDLRKKHTQECIQQHERDMELSFAIARSKEKVCGICFETVLQKTSAEQCFGILPNCNHCFCLSCIRRWRQAKQFENKIIRACPECRVTSDFVCPSAFWVDTKEDKDKVITSYKENLSRKDCKYFKQGRGVCPFGNKCFYMHAYPGGQKVDVGPPKSLRTIIEIPREFELIQRLVDLGMWQNGCPIISDEYDIATIVDLGDLSDSLSESDDSVYLFSDDFESWLDEN